MKPDESYKKLQERLLHLVEINNLPSERTKAENQLERKFMAAWQLAPDRRRLGYKLADAIRLFRTKDDKCVRGFDHCTCYTGENDQRIIVTQPYNSSSSEIMQDLTLNNGVCPEVIDATEWEFYYPGHASLFIVKFPSDFQKAMQDFETAAQRVKIKTALKTEKAESTYFNFAEAT